MATMCSTARCVVRGALLDLHMWTNVSMHGLGAKLAHCGCRVQFSHIAASLSCCARARTSCGQMSRRWICRPLRSVKTSKAGHSHPIAPCRKDARACWAGNSGPLVLLPVYSVQTDLLLLPVPSVFQLFHVHGSVPDGSRPCHQRCCVTLLLEPQVGVVKVLMWLNGQRAGLASNW